jgi:hypothetical protein
MSFGCQLTLCRKAESERFLGLVEIDVLLVRIQSSKRGRLAEGVDRDTNDWATFEAHLDTEKPSVVVEVSESGFIAPTRKFREHRINAVPSRPDAPILFSVGAGISDWKEHSKMPIRPS